MVLFEPYAVDEEFRKAWILFFCRRDKSCADLDAFRAVAEDFAPLLHEVQFSLLSGNMLHDAVQEKKPSAGSLDGWGWREFKALLVAWFERLASILWLVELEGVWPDGLLDAHIAMIFKHMETLHPLDSVLCVFFLM